MNIKNNVLFFLSLFLTSNLSAFFWGKTSDKDIKRYFKEMENDFNSGNCTEVISKYNTIMDKKPNSEIRLKILKYAGQCYIKLNEIDKALGLYKLAILLYPGEIDFKKRLGQIYCQNGFYENALELFLEVLQKNKNDYEIILLIARAYAKLGFLEDAKKYYIQYILNDEMKNEEILKEYINFLINKKDIDDALFLLNSVSNNENRYDLLILKARCMAYKSKFKEAIEFIEQAEKIQPLDREALIRKIMYSIFDGNYNLEKELEYFKNDCFGYFIRGILYYKNKNYLKAIENFKISQLQGGDLVSSISKSFLKRIENETKVLENVSCRK